MRKAFCHNYSESRVIMLYNRSRGQILEESIGLTRIKSDKIIISSINLL